jgi:hypothetical protein
MGCCAKAPRNGGEEAVLRVHEEVFPNRGRDGRHHEEGRDDEDAQHPLPLYRLVDQQRDQDTEDDGDDEDATDKGQRVE